MKPNSWRTTWASRIASLGLLLLTFQVPGVNPDTQKSIAGIVSAIGVALTGQNAKDKQNPPGPEKGDASKPIPPLGS